jgi:hypothetical protein
MKINDLLVALPAFDYIEDVIVEGDQDTKDIIKEVVNAHKAFQWHYDKIVGYFGVKNLLEELFNFCKKQLPYEIEEPELQTTRSPAAILVLRNLWGSDCKHYAGWIAGVIDAYNRAGLTNYNWCYRFASYKLLDPTKEHVFVVVKLDNDVLIWLDPAPIANSDHSFITRDFNDRKIYPFYSTDKYIETMSIARIMGIPYCSCNTVGSVTVDFYSSENIVEAPVEYFRRIEDYTGVGPVDEIQPYPDDSTIAADEDLPVDTGTVQTVMETTPPVTTTTETQNTASSGLSLNIDFFDIIKKNPVESVLIGSVLVVGIWYLVKPKKRKKRA